MTKWTIKNTSLSISLVHAASVKARSLVDDFGKGRNNTMTSSDIRIRITLFIKTQIVGKKLSLTK